MFITLTNLGGHKVRLNTDKIIKYSIDKEGYFLENSESYGFGSIVTLETNDQSVKETPEQIDEILRTSFIMVYDRK